ncbi:MAG TPA: translation elongation factor Ts [Cytophagales bacterium]|nr:translation elongation factor Ts [Cytophagales bacterium]
MAISAQDVNKLRQMTGAGMMDCKKALSEANGDFEAAIDILRKKGQKVSASRADKQASEGAVFATTNSEGTEGVIIALNCETDFVAKNDEFVKLGETLISNALSKNPSSAQDLQNIQVDGRAIGDLMTDLMGKIGEKIEIRSFERVRGEKVVPYIHAGAKLGVLVAFKGVGGAHINEVGKDVAMQIAAMNPVAVDKNDVDPSTVQREIEIGKDQARAEGKPEEMLEKIAVGKLNKFYKESTLLNQSFVKDPNKSISQLLNDVAKGLTVSEFKRVSVA